MRPNSSPNLFTSSSLRGRAKALGELEKLLLPSPFGSHAIFDQFNDHPACAKLPTLCHRTDRSGEGRGKADCLSNRLVGRPQAHHCAPKWCSSHPGWSGATWMVDGLLSLSCIYAEPELSSFGHCRLSAAILRAPCCSSTRCACRAKWAKLGPTFVLAMRPKPTPGESGANMI